MAYSNKISFQQSILLSAVNSEAIKLQRLYETDPEAAEFLDCIFYNSYICKENDKNFIKSRMLFRMIKATLDFHGYDYPNYNNPMSEFFIVVPFINIIRNDIKEGKHYVFDHYADDWSPVFMYNDHWKPLELKDFLQLAEDYVNLRLREEIYA